MHPSYLWCLLCLVLILASPGSASVLLANNTAHLNETEILTNTSVQTGPDQALFYTSACKSCIGAIATIQNISRDTACHIPIYDIATPENFTKFQSYQERFTPQMLGMPVLIAGDVAIGGNDDIKQYARDILVRPTPPQAPDPGSSPDLISQVLIGSAWIIIGILVILALDLIYTVLKPEEPKEP